MVRRVFVRVVFVTLWCVVFAFGAETSSTTTTESIPTTPTSKPEPNGWKPVVLDEKIEKNVTIKTNDKGILLKKVPLKTDRSGRLAENSNGKVPSFYVWLPTEILDQLSPSAENQGPFDQARTFGNGRSRPNYTPDQGVRDPPEEGVSIYSGFRPIEPPSERHQPRISRPAPAYMPQELPRMRPHGPVETGYAPQQRQVGFRNNGYGNEIRRPNIVPYGNPRSNEIVPHHVGGYGTQPRPIPKVEITITPMKSAHPQIGVFSPVHQTFSQPQDRGYGAPRPRPIPQPQIVPPVQDRGYGAPRPKLHQQPQVYSQEPEMVNQGYGRPRPKFVAPQTSDKSSQEPEDIPERGYGAPRPKAVASQPSVRPIQEPAQEPERGYGSRPRQTPTPAQRNVQIGYSQQPKLEPQSQVPAHQHPSIQPDHYAVPSPQPQSQTYQAPSSRPTGYRNTQDVNHHDQQEQQPDRGYSSARPKPKHEDQNKVYPPQYSRPSEADTVPQYGSVGPRPAYKKPSSGGYARPETDYADTPARPEIPTPIQPSSETGYDTGYDQGYVQQVDSVSTTASVESDERNDVETGAGLLDPRIKRSVCAAQSPPSLRSVMGFKEIAYAVNAQDFFDGLGVTDADVKVVGNGGMNRQSGGQYTFFVPSDEATKLTSPQLLQQLKQDRNEVMKMLRNHMIGGIVSLDQLRRGGSFPSKANDGAVINSQGHDNGVVTVNGQRVIYGDIPGPDGTTIHVISGFLYPTASLQVIPLVQSCNKYSGFMTLAEATGLSSELAAQYTGSTTGYTLFLPSNDALAKVPKEELDVIRNNSTAMREFLMYHVAEGIHYSEDLLDGQYLRSLHQGKSLRVGVNVDGCHRRLYEVNNSPLYRADIPASNGVVHVIDWVLLPSDHQWCNNINLP